MKKFIVIIAAFLAIVAVADQYIFSADGVAVGSSPRDLPSQGVRLSDGSVIVGLQALTDAQRVECGWYRLLPLADDPKPVSVSNETYRVKGYTFAATGTAKRVWMPYVKPVKTIRYSKLKIYEKLVKMGYWPSVKAWLNEQNLWEAFLIAQDVASDNVQFVQGLTYIVKQLGLTDEQVREFFADCIAS